MTNLSEEIKIKENRLMDYMAEKKYDAVVIGRHDNFAWITGGGKNKVIGSDPVGFGILVIKSDMEKYLLAYRADIDRIIEEELQGLGYQPVSIYWYESSPKEEAVKMLQGKRALTDIPLDGAIYDLDAIYRLHFPLTDTEVERYKKVGRETEKIIAGVVRKITPGMSELEVKGMLMERFAANDMEVDVLLVGSDERIFKYRHPLPTEKEIEKYLMISPSVSKWGLHVNIARFIHFGQPDNEIVEKYRAACNIATAAISESYPGNTFANILEIEKELYSKYNYPNEWKNHFQGGITGYMVSDAAKCLVKDEELVEKQTYEWFITISGVKSAELSFNDGKDQHLFSVNGLWPTETYTYKDKRVALPEILIL